MLNNKLLKNNKYHYIYSVCNADIVFVLSRYIDLREKNHPVKIITLDENLKNKLKDLSKRYIGSKLKGINQDISALKNYKWTICDDIKSITIFSLGTLNQCKFIKKAIDLKITVFYKDVYLSRKNYRLRFVDPINYLINGKKTYFSTKSYLIKQILKQLIFDPLRKKYYFGGEGDCWLTQKYVDQTKSVSLIKKDFKHKYKIPKKTILFAFSDSDDHWSPDWNFFKNSGYKLIIKEHPFTPSEYKNYPKSIPRKFSNCCTSDLLFDEESFLVSIASTSLRESINGISLIYIQYPNIKDGIFLEYAKKAKFLPKSYSELKKILK